MKKAYIIAGIAVILTAIMAVFPPQAEPATEKLSCRNAFIAAIHLTQCAAGLQSNTAMFGMTCALSFTIPACITTFPPMI